MRSIFLFSLLSLVACGGEAEKPAKKEAAKDAKPACDLSFAGLADTIWLRINPDGNKTEVQSRLKFYKEGEALKASYTAGSIVSVYTYDCTVAGDLMTCLETDKHLEGWCKAYASVHNGVCDPAAVAQQLSLPVEEVKPVAEAVNKELKGLNKAQTEQQRAVDNNIGNKIRSRFVVAVNKGKCNLTVDDKYLTMFNGQVQEYQNQNFTSSFAKDTGEYFWKSCNDMGAVVVDDAGKEVGGPYEPGTLKFQGGLGDKNKADASCTYTADLWSDWTKASTDLAGTVAGGKVTFSTAIPFANKGIHAVYFQSFKTCNGKKEEVGLSCKAFRVQ